MPARLQLVSSAFGGWGPVTACVSETCRVLLAPLHQWRPAPHTASPTHTPHTPRQVIECDIAPQVASRAVNVAPYKVRRLPAAQGRARCLFPHEWWMCGARYGGFGLCCQYALASVAGACWRELPASACPYAAVPAVLHPASHLTAPRSPACHHRRASTRRAAAAKRRQTSTARQQRRTRGRPPAGGRPAAAELCTRMVSSRCMGRHFQHLLRLQCFRHCSPQSRGRW